MTDCWIRVITEEVCPKCEEYYLLRDKHKGARAETITLDDGTKIKLGKLKKRDILECRNCGVIRKYKGEKTIPMTKENYREWEISHGTLQYKKFKKETKQKHLIRLHALKNLKKHNLSPQFYIDNLGGYDKIMMDLMEGINRIGLQFRIYMLRIGTKKDEINIPLLSFLIEGLKSKEINKKSEQYD